MDVMKRSDKAETYKRQTQHGSSVRGMPRRVEFSSTRGEDYGGKREVEAYLLLLNLLSRAMCH
jgi:hypothetical protein